MTPTPASLAKRSSVTEVLNPHLHHCRDQRQDHRVISDHKSKGPAKRISYLSLELCSDSKKFYIPEQKLLKITEKLKTLLEVRRVKLRDMARVLGLLQSCSRVLGNVVRI